jgi:hypothetical protein
MKTIYSLLIVVLTVSTTVGLAASTGSQKIDFTQKIKGARSEEKNLLKAFQAEIKIESPSDYEQEEVVEFLNSEIRWKAPKQNAKNSDY